MTTLTRRCFLTSSGAAAWLLWCRRAWAEQGREGTGFTFVQICDPQLGMGGYEHDLETFRLAVRHVNRLKPRPEFVLICGDLINTPGSKKQIDDFQAIKAGLEMGCYCVPGNHDLDNETNPALLKRYRQALGEDYYLKDLPGCVLIALNTQLWRSPLDGESEKQIAWLEKSMPNASAGGKPIVVFGHHPLFVRNPEEDEKYYSLPAEIRRRLLGLFTKHQVAAYLSGHTHRNQINSYQSIQLVTSATTSRNFDSAPMGFRLWHVGSSRPYQYEYVPIQGATPPASRPHTPPKATATSRSPEPQ